MTKRFLYCNNNTIGIVEMLDILCVHFIKTF